MGEIDLGGLDLAFEEPPPAAKELDMGSITIESVSLTPELVAVAIYEARGYTSIAARKLGTTVRVVNKFVKEYEICQVAQEEADTLLLDFAEAKLMQKIKAGDIASIIFYLKTKGKRRGYSEKMPTADEAKLNDDELADTANREQQLNDRLAVMSERLNYVPAVDVQPEEVDDGGDAAGTGSPDNISGERTGTGGA